MEIDSAATQEMFRIETFWMKDGRKVDRFAPIKMDSLEKPLYIGYANISPNPQMPPIPIRFPIEAENIDEAFVKFRESANRAVEAMQRESSRIVVPQGMPPPGLVGPGAGVGMKRDGRSRHG